MEFRHLLYFVAVAEELHFRRAAERQHVVHPALSQQVAKLEADPALAGTLETARRAHGGRAGVPRRGPGHAGASGRGGGRRASGRRREHGQLAVGFVGPAAYSVLPVVVRAFRGRHPDVDLSLHEHTTTEQLELLGGKQLDVGFLRLPAAAEETELEPLLAEPMCAVLPEGHPCDDRPPGHALPVADLAGEPFVVVPRSREAMVFDRIIAQCLGAKFSPRIVQEAQQVHAIIGLVAAGIGIALVPESMRALRRPGVVYRWLEPSPAAIVETGLAWRRSEASPVVASFVRLARTTLASAP